MEAGRARGDDDLVAVVVVAAPEFRARAAEEATRLGLGTPLDALPSGTSPDGRLALVLDERGWSLVDVRPGAPGAVRCDLLEGGLAARLRDGARGESRLAKALGLKRHPAPHVLDATAGLGRESVLAAALGCRVTACERSPVVALLLRDGLARAAAGGLADVVAQISVRDADAREVMQEMRRAGERPDVVLVDPMFPERKKTAAAKKEMQVLQRLLLSEAAGPSEAPGEAESLLGVALATAGRRVVVKRPTHAPPLTAPGGRGQRGPDLQVAGRAARYDVYLVASVEPGAASAAGRAIEADRG